MRQQYTRTPERNARWGARTSFSCFRGLSAPGGGATSCFLQPFSRCCYCEPRLPVRSGLSMCPFLWMYHGSGVHLCGIWSLSSHPGHTARGSTPPPFTCLQYHLPSLLPAVLLAFIVTAGRGPLNFVRTHSLGVPLQRSENLSAEGFERPTPSFVDFEGTN